MEEKNYWKIGFFLAMASQVLLWGFLFGILIFQGFGLEEETLYALSLLQPVFMPIAMIGILLLGLRQKSGFFISIIGIAACALLAVFAVFFAGNDYLAL